MKISNSELYKAIKKIQQAKIISEENIMELNRLVESRENSQFTS